MRKLEDRFWEKVAAKESDSCWLWTATKNNKGYGMFSLGAAALGKVSAHRMSYELAYGQIPKGRWVLHKCDTPACVNPDHLFLGTPKENVDDMDAKGRRTKAGIRGERIGTSRFTESQIVKMRVAYVAGERAVDIADRFGMSRNAINDVLSGRSWKHLLGVDECPTLDELKAATLRAMRNTAILSIEQVGEVKKLIRQGFNNAEIGRMFGVDRTCIREIKLGRNWPEVPPSD